MFQSRAEYWEAYNAYLRAWNVWAGMSDSSTGKHESYALEPIKTVNGIRYTDRYGHGYFEIVRQANGAPAFHFSNRDFVPLINGRSELRESINAMYDKDFFNKS